MLDALATVVAPDGHPRALRRLVEAALPGQEADPLAAGLRHEPVLRTNGHGAVATTAFVTEVVREGKDDAIARVRIVRREGTDGDARCHPCAAIRSRARRSAAASVEIPSRSAASNR